MKKLTLVFALTAVLVAAVVVFAACGPGRTAAPLRLEITTPSGRTATITTPTQMVSGIVSVPEATVTVNDIPVSVSQDGSFSHEIDLAYGTNRIVIAATTEGRDRPLTRTINVTRNLSLTVLSPEGVEIVAPLVTADSAILLSGRVSDPSARVLVTGDEVAVNEDGYFEHRVNLHYTLSTLNVTAMIEAVDPVTTLVTVQRAP